MEMNKIPAHQLPRYGPITDPLPQPVRPTSLHILRHPDRRSNWIVTGTVWFSQPLGNGTARSVREAAIDRVAYLAKEMPVTTARLRGTLWAPGAAPVPSLTEGDDPRPAWLFRPFNLGHEAPVRVTVDAEGRWLTVVAHHAAVDGVNAIPLFKILCGQPPVIPGNPPPMAKRVTPPIGVLRRLVHPADPVARSDPLPPRESFAKVPLPPVGKGMKGKLAAAVVKSILAHNHRYGQPLEHVGISASVMELDDAKPIASYRRVDLEPTGHIAETFERELSRPEEPWELLHAPRTLRLLSPITGRLSDTILLSNFGRWSLEGAKAIELYPVARGRSAVAIAAVRIAGGDSLLTIRACYLSQYDAQRILAETIDHLAG
ncbi:MAG: hypothetical protein ACYDGY_06635 [Acidimicrobiales bacterium]